MDVLQILYISDPYTMSEPLPHSKLSLEFPIWCTGIPVSTLISEWEPMNASLGVHQIKNFLGMFHLVPPPSPLYQMDTFQELLQVLQKQRSNFLVVGCPRPPGYQIGRPPGRLIGGVWAGGAPPDPPVRKKIELCSGCPRSAWYIHVYIYIH